MATPLTYLYAGQPLPEYYSCLEPCSSAACPAASAKTSTLALLIGGLYLHVPARSSPGASPSSFIGTVARALTLIFGHEGYGSVRLDAATTSCSGGLVARRLLHGDRLLHQPRHASRASCSIGRGLRRADRAHPLLRLLPRGRQSYAILIMNCCTWAIDKADRAVSQFGVSAEDVKATKAAKEGREESRRRRVLQMAETKKAPNQIVRLALVLFLVSAIVARRARLRQRCSPKDSIAELEEQAKTEGLQRGPRSMATSRV